MINVDEVQEDDVEEDEFEADEVEDDDVQKEEGDDVGELTRMMKRMTTLRVRKMRWRLMMLKMMRSRGRKIMMLRMMMRRRRRKMMMLRMMMLRRRTDSPTATLCASLPQLKCTSTLHKSHFAQ